LAERLKGDEKVELNEKIKHYKKDLHFYRWVNALFSHVNKENKMEIQDRQNDNDYDEFLKKQVELKKAKVG
jgi:hypothetical protein